MEKPDSQVAPVDPPAKKSGSMTLLKAIAFVSVIVLLEVAAASMMIPTSEETKDLAEKVAAADAAQELGAQGEVAIEDSEAETLALADMLEVSLGSFHVLTYNPDSGSSLNIDFELFGTVLNEEESEFYLLYDAHSRANFDYYPRRRDDGLDRCWAGID